jgi:hypothetical protein
MCSTFIYLFNSLYKSIFVPIGIVVNNSFSSINIGYFLPAVGFSWGVVVHSGELEGVADSEVELVLAILKMILDLFNDISEKIFIYCYAFNQPIDLKLILIITLPIDIHL